MFLFEQNLCYQIQKCFQITFISPNDQNSKSNSDGILQAQKPVKDQSPLQSP